MAVDKRSVVTAVLCAVAALGASAAVAELVPPPEATAPVHAKSAAAPSGSPNASSRPQASKPQLGKPRQTPAAPAAPNQAKAAAFTGALFTGSLDGDHFCTATVVRSPGKNMLVTAGHCLLEGQQSRDGGAVFAPGTRTASLRTGSGR